jgi:hypothetical protein
MCLLKLGDKTGLYKDTAQYSRIKGAGFMHIVAVSGVLLRFLVVWPIAVKPQKQGLYGLYPSKLS